jgi:hypothetical protein
MPRLPNAGMVSGHLKFNFGARQKTQLLPDVLRNRHLPFARDLDWYYSCK